MIVLCLALWLPGFFTLPPSDRDESRFAQATRQMTESGDYVRILNGAEPRNRKPVGIHWLQAPFALAAEAAGLPDNTIWVYRLPSLLGALLAVLMTYQLGLGLFDRRAALLAAAMLAACTIVAAETRIAKTDAALLGVTTLAMMVLAHAWLGQRVARWQAALFWIGMGAGILIKGPIAPLVAGLATAVLCWRRRGWRWLLVLRPASGLPLMLAMLLPWFVAIERATPGFLRQAVGGDLGRKLVGGDDAHGGLPGLHLLLVPLLAFPASAAVIAAVPRVWAARREPGVEFLLAWLVPSWLVFEAVPTKLPHYPLPLYPALFLLAAWAWPHAAAAPRALRWLGAAALAVVTLGVSAGMLVLPLAVHGAWWRGVAAAAGMLLVGGLALRGRLGWALVAAPLFYAGLLGVELPNLPAFWIGPRVAEALRSDWPGWNAQGAGLGVVGYAEPSLMFATGRDLLTLPDAQAAATALATRRVGLVIVEAKQDRAFRALLPAARQIDVVHGYNYSRGRAVTLEFFVL